MVTNGEPASGILHITAIFLETKSAVVAAKYIDATAAVGRFQGFDNQVPGGHVAALGAAALVV